MVADLIDGRARARLLREEVAAELKAVDAAGRQPGLVTVLVGDDYRAAAYEHRLRRVASEIGMPYRCERLGADASLAEVVGLVFLLGKDPGVSGILVFRPLPRGLDEGLVFRALPPEKDIEAVHPENAGLLALGTPRFVPSTPAAVYHLLDSWLDDVGEDRVGFYRRSSIVVVGRSNNVGKPAVSLGMSRGAMVVSVDEHASAAGRLAEQTLRADVLIVAAGVPGLIGPGAVREGAVVLDVGINPVTDPATGAVRLVGDVAPSVAGVARAMTPVPGGVGPVTDVWLFRNAVHAAEWTARA